MFKKYSSKLIYKYEGYLISIFYEHCQKLYCLFWAVETEGDIVEIQLNQTFSEI